MTTSPHAIVDKLHDENERLRDEIADLHARVTELEAAYVPHLPADTDTWLRDASGAHIEYPLPPRSQVKMFYGPGERQFLTVETTDRGLRIYAAGGWLTLSAAAPNIFHVTGSVK